MLEAKAQRPPAGTTMIGLTAGAGSVSSVLVGGLNGTDPGASWTGPKGGGVRDEFPWPRGLSLGSSSRKIAPLTSGKVLAWVLPNKFLAERSSEPGSPRGFSAALPRVLGRSPSFLHVSKRTYAARVIQMRRRERIAGSGDS